MASIRLRIARLPLVWNSILLEPRLYLFAMVDVLKALILSVLLIGVGDLILSRLLRNLDSSLRIGVAAIVGMGALGFVVWLACFAQIGSPQSVATVLTLVFGAVGAYGLWRMRADIRLSKPEGAALVFPVLIGGAALMAMLAAAGPSDSMDWDSLAYHLAVPKLWIENGAMHPVTFIHHSNFPFMVDSLFLVGLALGGASMAKGFMAAFLIWGALALFGFARNNWGGSSGWWAALAFVGIPTVFWESGTAYIDVAHGLYAGLGTLFVARWLGDATRRNELWLGAILLGGGAASKYTGYQTILACVAVVGIYGLIRQEFAERAKGAVLIGCTAVAIGAPWLVKNVAWTGNPVYPFFYEKFGGKNWDQFSADIYREEQQSFGVAKRESGGKDFSQIGHAVLGLAYQPGRYVNPRQTEGGGFPIGALGIVPFAGAIAWLLSGRIRREEGAVLAVVGVSFLFWFLLSQQSRYLLNLGIPMAVLAGGAMARLSIRPFVGALIVAQFSYSAWLAHTFSLAPKLPFALGRVTLDDYHQSNGPPFYLASKLINREVGRRGKVALYDEVFGYFLDVPYFWANPGHSTEIGYADLDDGKALAAKLRSMGFSHVFLSLVFQSPDVRQRWIEAAGLVPDGRPFEGEERVQMCSDLRSKWRVLLAEAVRSGDLKLVEPTPGGLFFAFAP